jgi:hypothetical protein
MTTPKVGDRRPRDGRCERCDRPLTDEAYVQTTLIGRAIGLTAAVTLVNTTIVAP